MRFRLLSLKRWNGESAQGGNGNKNERSTRFLKNPSPIILIELQPSLKFKSMTSFQCLYCWLWTKFTHCFDVSIVDLEQINVLSHCQYWETVEKSKCFLLWNNYDAANSLLSCDFFIWCLITPCMNVQPH